MNENYKRVVDALPAYSEDDEWARPTAVAEALDMKLKTVRDHLRNAVKAGDVETAKDDDGLVIYRQSAKWSAGGDVVPRDPVGVPLESAFAESAPAVEPLSEAESVLDAMLGPEPAPYVPSVPNIPSPVIPTFADGTAEIDAEGDDASDETIDVGPVTIIEPAESEPETSEPATPTEVPADGGSEPTDELSAVLGAMESDRPGVTAALAAPAPGRIPVKGSCTYKGCNAPVTRIGRAWKHDDAALDENHRPTTRDPRRAENPAQGDCTTCGARVIKDGRSWTHMAVDGRSADKLDADHKPTTQKRVVRTGTQNRQFNPGELKGKVTGFLQDAYRADPGKSFTIKAVSEATGASVSSAAYALELLVNDGVARCTGVAPYTYRAE